MADKGSVFQKGGGGTNFEQAIQTAFLTTLIIRGNAPLNFANEIIEVAFQTTNRGYETDDLLVVAKSAIGQHRLLVQIKNNITFTTDNALFKEVIKAFWKDYNSTALFDKAKDRLIIIKSGFTKEERNHLKLLLDWANTHATDTDFVTEANRIKGKKVRLDFFRESLKEVNNNIALTDKEIWEFLKCFDVLEYDFTNQNSVDEIYFLNLIKLCKSNETTSNEKEIWASISSFVSKLNKDGGSVTIESITNEELYKHFDTKKLSPYFKSIEKLRRDSEVILLPLKNTIGGLHLDRKNISQSISDSVNNFQFTIVTGKPGVGKSAEIKDVLKNEFPSASIFVFRADQFNEPHIANVFSSQGVNETLQDIFSCISLIPDKIIFIDSLEKLLETDPECAFKQLLALLKQFPDIKIIGSSRKYAVDLITQKFGIDKMELGNAEVLPLDENELNIVAKKFPQLLGVLKNEKIKKLLQSPKYLDFAILALNKSDDDYANISLTEFKDKLWNSLVKDSTNRTKGFPAKREDAFMEIAINRAKEMKLFTRTVNGDKEAIDLLENDEIIFQENENRRYSPTHDILEDWALVKYVSSKYDEFPIPKELFENLGTEPAIRRAFRLWVEDYLIDDDNKVNELIRASINNNSIDKYWADEILIAVFKSENCASFFSAFETELLVNRTPYHFLNRCLHLIRTACKESNINDGGSSLLLPVGSGWKEALIFIDKHITKLEFLSPNICNFLFDWKYLLMFQYSQTSEEEKLAAKKIVIYYLNILESAEDYWKQGFVVGRAKELVSVLYQLAEIAKQEITDLMERAFNEKETRGFWRQDSFYKDVITKSVSGLGNQILVENLPELVVKTAWREWKLNPMEDSKIANSLQIPNRSLRREEYWGIEDNFTFFPSGIYKTFLYNMLWFHRDIGLKFIVDFINYSVEFYVSVKSSNRNNLIEVEIQLNDGTNKKLWGSWELWASYRGLSVTNYLIESLLMSLEKYLLETAERKTMRSKEILKSTYDYLILNCNNVSVVSVLTSVAIAFPEEVEEALLPLLSVKEFYDWDLTRAIRESESNSNAFEDRNISFAQEERLRMNQLPHRQKYLRGLRDFIGEYQLSIRKLNKEIHFVFDKLNKEILKEDIVWKKTLTEIDIRNLRVGEYDAALGGFPIQSEYSTEVVDFINSDAKHFEKQSKSLNTSAIIKNAFEQKEHMDYKTWKDCFKLYSKKGGLNLFFDRPISLAILGLRDFSEDLGKKEKNWCVKTLNNSISAILKDTFEGNLGIMRNYNLMEKQIALSAFHHLFNNCEEEGERYTLISTMIYLLFAPFSVHEVDKILVYVREVFFKMYPKEGKIIWIGLIKLSRYRNENQYFYDDYDTERLKENRLKEKDFIQSNSSSKDVSLDMNQIDLENCDGHILARAFAITPYDSEEDIFPDFIKHFISLLFRELNYDHHYSPQGRGQTKRITVEATIDAERYLSEILLKANSNLSTQLFDLLISPIYSEDIKDGKLKYEISEFLKKIFNKVIYLLDDIIAGSTNEVFNQDLIIKFWNLWEYFFNDAKKRVNPFFTSILLLGIDWKAESSHWRVLDNKSTFYYELVRAFGKDNTQVLVDLFSSAGEKTFLPEGISWLVEIYEEDLNTVVSLNTIGGERLIKRLFHNHISKIKNNKKLIEDFVWILDRMVDRGSSDAYFFRENVITYKSLN